MQKAGQIALVIYILASSAAVLIIKNFFNMSTYEDLSGFIHLLVNIKLIGGIILYKIGFLSWLYVLSKMNLSTAYPIATTLSFLSILFLSILILREKFTLNIFIGTILCITGILIIIMET
jgi:drug/metabolite transporter (DMT)-like permease